MINTYKIDGYQTILESIKTLGQMNFGSKYKIKDIGGLEEISIYYKDKEDKLDKDVEIKIVKVLGKNELVITKKNIERSRFSVDLSAAGMDSIHPLKLDKLPDGILEIDSRLKNVEFYNKELESHIAITNDKRVYKVRSDINGSEPIEMELILNDLTYNQFNHNKEENKSEKSKILGLFKRKRSKISIKKDYLIDINLTTDPSKSYIMEYFIEDFKSGIGHIEKISSDKYLRALEVINR